MKRTPASVSRKHQSPPTSAPSGCGSAVTTSGPVLAHPSPVPPGEDAADRTRTQVVNRNETGVDKASIDKAAFDKARRALYDYWKA